MHTCVILLNAYMCVILLMHTCVILLNAYTCVILLNAHMCDSVKCIHV